MSATLIEFGANPRWLGGEIAATLVLHTWGQTLSQHVCFRYKDYAHGNRRKVIALAAAEFIRRFLLHVLPTGFMRIRHYGILANRAKREKLAAARVALDYQPAPEPSQPESVAAFWLRVANLDVHLCPHCHAGCMVVIGPLRAPRARAPPLPPS